VLRTAERPRYVVQYELAATWAFAVNQSLQGNDQIKVGLYDFESGDGWYMEHRGDHADDEADFVLERNSSEVYRETNADLHKAVTVFARLKLQTGWYDVTRQRWERSYPERGRQQNPVIGLFSADDARGPRTGNLPLHYEASADASTTGLTLNAGSCAQVNLGTTKPYTRSKTGDFTFNVGTTGTWLPAHAIRVDPDREIVNTQLRNTDVVSAQGNTRVVPMSFSPTHVADGSGNALTDTDFSTPEEQSPMNSVIEEATSVGQVADSTGTLAASMANPGGHQLGYGSWWSSGSGSKTQAESGSTSPKRQIPPGDICVFLVKADTTGEITVEYITDQDW
jgi:hypothetical protein